MNSSQTIYATQKLTPLVQEKLLKSQEEAENLVMRDIRCPYCGFLVEKVFSDIFGHKQVYCKKCKREYIINLGYFRRQKKKQYFKMVFPDKGQSER